ncbi:hypothetical protein, partial [Avibacterium gallinarum]|uniref:hypothetical protein n=1 Tax=Avibacterium gallinarum TaxID=755 RepID=UPI003BF85F79
HQFIPKFSSQSIFHLIIFNLLHSTFYSRFLIIFAILIPKLSSFPTKKAPHLLGLRIENYRQTKAKVQLKNPRFYYG